VREGFGDPAAGGPYKTRRSFLDFVINGISLYDAIGIRRDVISVLWNPPVVPDEADRAIRRLLLLETGDASNGRVSLLVCAECGDLGCGAMTARIEQGHTGIVWRDIGYENTYDLGVDLDSFATVGPFIFEPDAYRKKLEPLLSP
jgi:hypothetical protein